MNRGEGLAGGIAAALLVAGAMPGACLPALEAADPAVDAGSDTFSSLDGSGGSEASGSSGASGKGDASGGSDAPTGCVPSECPGGDTDCVKRACFANQCIFEMTPAGADCDDDGGRRCDGDGSCVLCRADGTKNDGETDIDCGGGDCPKCADLLSCEIDDDCDSGNCEEKLCIPASCSDGVPNGNETDEDCGGPSCLTRCAPGQMCDGPQDCATAACVAGRCCGVSCSGPCRVCAPDTGACGFVAAGSDPRDECPGPANDCDGMGGCEQCSDLTKNGDETDFDCGGPTCAPCAVGKSCLMDSDCESCTCESDVCGAPVCDNGVKDGCETDVDCGGPCGATCTLGQACAKKADCVSLSCADSLCVPP